MIRICSFHPGIDDTTSYYRGAWPMMRLAQAREDIEVTFNPDISLASIAGYDILFFQRPSTVRHLEVIQNAKELGLPVWIDQDDNLFCVPKDNPFHGLYENFETKTSVTESFHLADVVTTATEHLAKEYSRFGRKTFAIPNAFDDKGPLLKRRSVRSRNHTISWRGTQTHAADLLSHKDALIEIDRKFHLDGMPRPTWLFFGAHPWMLEDAMPKLRYVPSMSYLKYMELFQIEAPFLHVVPLSYSPFSLCKSNISWIEASYAGAAVIAPDWPEWRKPGIQHFGRIDFAADMADLASQSWEFICDTLFLSKVNEQRSQIVDYLMGLR